MNDKIHEECPNNEHCEKDNTKCCYLVNRKCLIKEARKYEEGYDGIF